MADQKKELENREITIRAIQRNFEQLSVLTQVRSCNISPHRIPPPHITEASAANVTPQGLQADKEQIKTLQKKLEEMSKNAADDKEKKLAAKYPQLKEAFDSLNDKYCEAEAKIDKLLKQGKSDKDAAAAWEKERQKFQREAEALKKQAEVCNMFRTCMS